MISFRTWLLRQRRRKDAIGDLAKDVAKDPWWPEGDDRGDAGLREVLEHLERASACEGAKRAARDAWGEYISRHGRYQARDGRYHRLGG